jgi:hypothetical protein
MITTRQILRLRAGCRPATHTHGPSDMLRGAVVVPVSGDMRRGSHSGITKYRCIHRSPALPPSRTQTRHPAGSTDAGRVKRHQ